MQTRISVENTVSLALSAEVKVIEKFVELLKLEQAELSNGSSDKLLDFANQKDVLASQINGLATQRNNLLTAQGFKTDRAGIEAWCSKNPKEVAAASAWTSILSLAREAHELNRLNGELIQIRLQYNNRALEALQGGKKALDLYGPDGQSTSLGYQRINHSV